MKVLKFSSFLFALVATTAFAAGELSDPSIRVREKLSPVCSEVPVAGAGSVISVQIPSGSKNDVRQYLVSSTYRIKGRLLVEHSCDSENQAGSCQFAVESKAQLRTNSGFNRKVGFAENSITTLAVADAFSGAVIVDDKIREGKLVKVRQNVPLNSGASFVKGSTTSAGLSGLASYYNGGVIDADLLINQSSTVIRNGTIATGPNYEITHSFEGVIEVCHYYLDFTFPYRFE